MYFSIFNSCIILGSSDCKVPRNRSILFVNMEIALVAAFLNHLKMRLAFTLISTIRNNKDLQ